MRKPKKVRIVPTFRKGKEHAGHPDGFVVHPEDRAVRRLPTPLEKVNDQDEPVEGGNGVV